MHNAAANARLAATIAAHGQLVLPVFVPPPGVLAVRPLPPFAAAARLGHAQALVDRDGVTRRFLARESDGNVIYAHLALELLAGGNGAMPGVAFVANVLDAGRARGGCARPRVPPGNGLWQGCWCLPRCCWPIRCGAGAGSNRAWPR